MGKYAVRESWNARPGLESCALSLSFRLTNYDVVSSTEGCITCLERLVSNLAKEPFRTVDLGYGVRRARSNI